MDSLPTRKYSVKIIELIAWFRLSNILLFFTAENGRASSHGFLFGLECKLAIKLNADNILEGFQGSLDIRV